MSHGLEGGHSSSAPLTGRQQTDELRARRVRRGLAGGEGVMPNPSAADTSSDTMDRKTQPISAGHLLLVLRRQQIPCSIDSFSADGWTARLGDPAKGAYSQQGYFPTRQAAAEWLLEEAERFR